MSSSRSCKPSRGRGRSAGTDVAAKLAAAQAAAAQAEWSRVAELTDALEPTKRDERVALAFLRARVALHAEVPAVALAALDGLAGVEGGPDELATRDVLRGRALVALGRYVDAVALLKRAAKDVQGELRAEAQLALADSLVSADRPSEAETILASMLATALPGRTSARVLALQARVEIRRGRRPTAALFLRDALSALGGDEPELRIELQATLLAIAIETLDVRLVNWVRAELPAGEGTSVPSFAVVRLLNEQLAWGALLQGDLETAWDLAADAREHALPGVPAIAADLLTMQVASAAGERFTPEQLLTRAVSQAEHVDWGAAGVFGRRVLLGAAELAGTADLSGAADLLNVYDELLPLDAASAAGQDVRDLGPLETMARAAVAGASGLRDVQARALVRAVAQWRELGNDLGELRALLALARAAPNSPELARAAALTTPIPRSWLRRECELYAERARGLEQLSPAERRVLDAICEGLTTIQIAAKFGRSKNTIRNQTRRIYKLMEVQTRSALVAKCASLGLLTSTRSGHDHPAPTAAARSALHWQNTVLSRNTP